MSDVVLPGGAVSPPEGPASNPEEVAEPVRAPGGRGGVKRRRRQSVARPHAVMVRLSDEEYGLLSVAAAAAGVTTTGYVGMQAVAVARAAVDPLPARWGDVVREVVETRRQLVRYGVLLNQAVARLHTTGIADGRLDAAVRACEAAVAATSGAMDRLGRR